MHIQRDNTEQQNNNNNGTKIQIVDQTAAVANGELQKNIYKYKNKETLNHFHDRPKKKKLNKNSEQTRLCTFAMCSSMSEVDSCEWVNRKTKENVCSNLT